MKKKLIFIASFFFLILVILLSIPFLIPLNSLKPEMESFLSESSGYGVSFKNISLNFFPTTSVVVEGLNIKNNNVNILKVDKVMFKGSLFDFIRGDFNFSSLLVKNPVIFYDKNSWKKKKKRSRKISKRKEKKSIILKM